MKNNIMKQFRPAIICLISMIIICGVIYTGVVTGIGQILFPNQANGSIIEVTLKDGTKVSYGSELIAQEFTKPEYLIGRPSGVSNLSPESDKQKKLVEERIEWWHKLDPSNKKDIPIDLVEGSGSGVDPNISVGAAEYQISRIAKARNISEDEVKKIIARYTTDRFLGLFGEPVVNVLKVNLALDNKLE